MEAGAWVGLLSVDFMCQELGIWPRARHLELCPSQLYGVAELMELRVRDRCELISSSSSRQPSRLANLLASETFHDKSHLPLRVGLRVDRDVQVLSA